MGLKTETIEIDADTASALKSRAAARGVSVADLISELVPLVVDDEALVVLDSRWAAVEAGAATVPQAEVERWLETWGTPQFRPWSER